MLYDTRWDAKIDPFTLEALIAWLETRPKEEIYCWQAVGSCLLGQYASHIDPTAYFYPSIGSGGLYKYIIDGQLRDLAPFGGIAYGEPRTFGAALERARFMASGRYQASTRCAASPARYSPAWS